MSLSKPTWCMGLAELHTIHLVWVRKRNAWKYFQNYFSQKQSFLVTCNSKCKGVTQAKLSMSVVLRLTTISSYPIPPTFWHTIRLIWMSNAQPGSTPSTISTRLVTCSSGALPNLMPCSISTKVLIEPQLLLIEMVVVLLAVAMRCNCILTPITSVWLKCMPVPWVGPCW